MSDDIEFPHVLATDHKRKLQVVMVHPAAIELRSTDGAQLVQNAERHALHVLAMRILSLEAENASLHDVQRQARFVLASALENVDPETSPLVTLATRVTKHVETLWKGAVALAEENARLFPEYEDD